MATRLKNIKYKPFFKAFNMLLLLLCLIMAVCTAFYTVINYDYIEKSTFYETDTFYSLFKRNINDAMTYEFDETFKEDYINNHLSEREYLVREKSRIEARLGTNQSFIYYFLDGEGNIFTNLKKNATPEYIMENKDYIHVKSDIIDPVTRFGNFNMYSIISGSEKYDVEIWAAVQRSIYENDEFSLAEREFSAFKHDYSGILVTGIVLAILALILFVVIIITAGKSSHDDKPKRIFIDYIFNEVQYLILIGYIGLFTAITASVASGMDIGDRDFDKIFILISVYGTFIYIGCLVIFMSFVRLIKTRSYIENFLIYKLIRGFIKIVMGIIRGALFNPLVIGGMAGLAILNILVGVIGANSSPGGGMVLLIIIIAIDSVAIKLTYEFLKSLKTLTTATGLVAEGTMDYDLSNEKISKSLLTLTDNILKIKEGIKNAVEKELKIEKMKANLITNVSHDLKTPLTSIITYTKLLKDKDLSDEEAIQYVEIIDSKSEKLKRLIEDIVEVNKASTGNIIVELGQLNLTEVVNQISGEYEDGLAEKNLKLITDGEKKTVEVTADGKLVFRVFENLLDNVLKYALGGTRVFVDVSVEDNFGVVTIKNITNHSLESITEEELTDRFVRADESRSSDGFGLGLSIADSLVKSMNGVFEIMVDGDLFKTKIKLPLKISEKSND